MVKPVTRLSIPMSILRLNFITKLIFIHLIIYTYDIPGKIHNPINHIMDNNGYIFLHITPVASLSTADLTPNLSESNCFYPYYKWYNNRTNSLAVLRIIIQTLDKNSSYTIQLLISCLDDVLEK